ncbi:MAG: PhoH family protein [Pseudomonadota bacterium]
MNTSRLYPIGTSAQLADICGPHHRHLQLIEARLAPHDLTLTPESAGIVMSGQRAGVDLCEQALRNFERRVSGGADPVQLEMEGALAEAEAQALDGFTAIKGLRKPVTAQSAGQGTYLKALTNPANGLVFGAGPAGTGKTFLAVAVGASELLSGARQRLIVTRPAVEAGEKLGFLPGSLEEKVDPYMMPIWDALRELLGGEQMTRRLERGDIEVAPLAFMRGRTLKNAFVIVDEAQNTTVAQMKMVLTRLGRDSRMVVTGDPGQVDLPKSVQSGLAHGMRILAGVPGVKQIPLSGADVVRHDLVSRIIDAYAKADEA